MLLGRWMTPILPARTGRARAKALRRSHRPTPPGAGVQVELAVEQAVVGAKAAHPSKSSGRTERQGRMRAPAVGSLLRGRGAVPRQRCINLLALRPPVRVHFNENQPVNDTPEPPQVTKLPPSMDSCLLGATLRAPQQFAYSLRKLVRMEMMRGNCKASEAREEVLREYITPYAREVCFIDDELLDPISDVEKPTIILPNQINGRK